MALKPSSRPSRWEQSKKTSYAVNTAAKREATSWKQYGAYQEAARCYPDMHQFEFDMWLVFEGPFLAQATGTSFWALGGRGSP